MFAEISRLPFAIVSNPYFQSFEVTFDEKPAQKIIDALKNLKMRWNPKKRCWYGFHPENVIREAILGASEETETPATVVTEGYLGASAFYGCKSHKSLYGADLSAAIRANLKAAGIKGTVRCKSYTGGQSLTITLTATDADFMPFEHFLANTDNVDLWHGRFAFWLPSGEYISREDFFEFDDQKKKQVRELIARQDYEAPKVDRIHVNYMEDYEHIFTPEFLKKVEKAHAIVLAYRYDDSNSQVDYFDTNFYYDFKLKMK